jgi:hypothetical protein
MLRRLAPTYGVAQAAGNLRSKSFSARAPGHEPRPFRRNVPQMCPKPPGPIAVTQGRKLALEQPSAIG